MTNNYYNLAKKYDKKGKFAFMGMYSYLEESQELFLVGDNGEDAIAYLVETYLECIESVSFQDWIRKGNEDGKPFIMSENQFKKFYSEIFEMNISLQGAIDDIAILYDCEWWIFDSYEHQTTFLATSYYKDYTAINLFEIERAMAIFDNLLSLKELTSKRRETLIKRINQASNNLLNKYKIEEMSDDELFELIDSKFGLGYCSGLYEEWDLRG